jgi:vitamin B12 transporter
MQNIRLLAFIILVPFVKSGFGQINTDTLITLPCVEISSLRTFIFDAGARITRIDSLELSLSGSESLDQILKGVSSISIRTQGPGLLSTPSFRGTASTHTAVRWNGFTLNSPNLGLSDLSLIPSGLFDDIHIKHGSSGPLAGSNAIGGTIELNNISVFEKRSHASGSLEKGSFGNTVGRVSVSASGTKFSSRSSFYAHQAENNFPFVNTARFGSPVVKQSNNALNKAGFMTSNSYRINKSSHIHTGAWFQQSYREIAPSMTAFSSSENQTDSTFRAYLNWNLNIKSYKLTLGGAWFNEFFRYADPDKGIYSKSDVTVKKSTLSMTKTRNKNWINSVGFDVDQNTALIDNYKGKKDFLNGSAFAGLVYDSPKTKLNAALRTEFNDGYIPFFTPLIGLQQSLLSNKIFLKSQLSRNYNAPSMNDRYWQPGGNPDLLPESGLSGEAGMLVNMGSKNEMQTEITTHASIIQDWLQWQPGENGLWQARNHKEVFVRGMELSLGFRHSIYRFSVSVKGIYSYTESTNQKVYGNNNPELLKKQLIYVPIQTGGISLTITDKRSVIFYRHTVTGERFVTADNSAMVDGYHLATLKLSHSLNSGITKFQLSSTIDNLFNTQYQSVKWYAMPGRSYKISFGILIP